MKIGGIFLQKYFLCCVYQISIKGLPESYGQAQNFVGDFVRKRRKNELRQQFKHKK